MKWFFSCSKQVIEEEKKCVCDKCVCDKKELTPKCPWKNGQCPWDPKELEKRLMIVEEKLRQLSKRK